MPVQLDIAGNFGRGQRVAIERRLGRQTERANDYELAQQDEKLKGRRDNIRQQEEVYGLDPMEFAPLNTNQDPWFDRLLGWWKQKRANRVMPSNMMPEQTQSLQDEAQQMGGDRFQQLQQEDPMQPARTYPMGARPAYRNGGKVAIPRYADGGSADEDEMARRRRRQDSVRRASKTEPMRQAGGSDPKAAEAAMTPERRAAREAEFRRNGIDTKIGEAGPPPEAIPVRPGMIARAGSALRRGVNTAGKKFAPIALGATAVDTAMTDSDRYRKRFGLEPSSKETGFWNDVGVRALGAASDLGNVLTMGAAGSLYRDNQAEADEPPQQPEQPTAIPPAAESPKTPDEEVAQQAISDGKQMAAEAAQQSAPPGQIDFSKTDFNAGDIPNMGVKDWVDYRGRMVRNLMAQGATPVEAHAQVTKLQQQGFVDYAQQALMHLQAGDPNSAATALRAAYQYFPNGTDVEVGVSQGQDGQPVLIGRGKDEVSGAPKGQPMVLNSERLAAMIENFSNPGAFTAWTKDWRDEQFKRQKYAEVERPTAQSEATYRGRAGRAAEMNAQANLEEADAKRVAAGGGSRKQVDLDRANAAFVDAVEALGYTDQAKADRLMSIMSQIYSRSNWEYPKVIEFVRAADSAGKLEQVAAQLGIQ